MDKRNQFRIALVVAMAAFFGVRYLYKPQAGGAAEPASTAPAPVRNADGSITAGSLVFKPCELAAPQTGATTSAYCAPFSVPENWDAPTGRRIDLKLAMLASTAAAPPADPVVLIAGGPGQSATEAWPQASSSFTPMREKRNILLLDQRGTGGSNALTCARGLDDVETESSFDLDRVRAQTKACLDKVSAHADPRFYTTTMALRDLEALREALGSPRFNLVGASYGTRVAQEYAKAHPDAVRTVLLDSAVPNDNALGSDFAGNLDAALKAQFAVCAADAKCAKAFGDPWANLQKLRAILNEKSVEVSYRDPVDNAQKTMHLGADTLAALGRMYAYMPETSALLPLGISRAVAGDYAPLAGQAQMLGQQMKSLADNAMQLSVVCSEDADRIVARDADKDALLGSRFAEVLAAECAIWPHGTRPANFNAPLAGDVPVLIIGGEFDPVTPPRYAEAIVKTLPKGRVLIAKGQGHSVLGRGCFPRLAARFIDTRDALSLDAGCVKDFSPIPAFIDFNGAAP